MFRREKKTMFVVTIGYDDANVGISPAPAIFRNLVDAEGVALEVFKNWKPEKTWVHRHPNNLIHYTYIGKIMNIENPNIYLDGWCELYELQVK